MEIKTESNTSGTDYVYAANATTIGVSAANNTTIGGSVYWDNNYCTSCHTWYAGWHNCCHRTYTTLVAHSATEAQLLKAWLDGFLTAGGKLTEKKLKQIQEKLEEHVNG